MHSGGVSRGQELGQWLDQARGGCSASLEKLIKSYRKYLLLIANHELDGQLRGKVGASDLVQDTCLLVQQNIAEFRGNSQEELLAWLRRILLNHLANVRNQFQTEKRQISREASLDGSGSFARLVGKVADGGRTPLSEIAAAEQASLLRAALARLPEDYRRVVLLRNWERYSFTEIGERMQRSADAVRKLWGRAVVRLHEEMNGADDV